MDRERWGQLEKLFEEAIEIPEQGRKAFIEGACGSDRELRAELEYLVQCHREAGALLEGTALDGAPELQEQEPAPPRRLGAWAIGRCLGRGGMGSVYLGERADEQYQQRAAVKISSRGFDDPALASRFRSERQILANLNHPNIARLLDGGTTDQGVGYLVMEYVEGVPIDEYIRARALPIPEKLILFRTVCSAVEEAHRQGIIHRDLKPGNILVLPDGVPKLLDFGIAKLIGPSASTQGPEPASPLLHFLTPEYASPEQIRGEPVTAATDVYSLGVLLYVLLTGRHPYRLNARAPHEIARMICEEEPEQPAVPIRGGDLDHILLKALAKQPERRYFSVAELSEDIRRYQEGYPVLARPETLGYLCRKFVRRHRLGVLSAATVGVALAAGLCIALRQTQLARSQRAAAFRESARAEQKLNDVLALADSLISDPAESIPANTQVRLALIQNALHYLDRFSGEDTGNLELRRAVATAYLKIGDLQGKPYTANLGDTAGALRSYSRAAALLESLPRAGPGNPETQAALSAAYEALGTLATRQVDYPRATGFLRRALEIRERLSGADLDNPKLKRLIGMNCIFLGDVLQYQGHLKDANAFYLRSLMILDHAASESGPAGEVRQELAKAYQRVGANLEATGYDLSVQLHYPQEARGAYRKALEYDRRSFEIARELAAFHPGNARLRRAAEDAGSDTARMLGRSGQSHEAIALFTQMLSEGRSLADEDPANAEARFDLAVLYKHLADAQTEARDMRSAERNYREAIRIDTALHDSDPGNGEITQQLGTSIAGLQDLHARAGNSRGIRDDIRADAAWYAQAHKSGEWRPMLGMARLLERSGDAPSAARMTDRALTMARLAADSMGGGADAFSYAEALLSCRPARFRDPKAAIMYARRALAGTGVGRTDSLGLLARAYYVDHQEQAAVETMREALTSLPYTVRVTDDDILDHLRGWAAGIDAIM